MSIHADPSPLADDLVKIVKGRLAGNELLVEDWWDRVAGQSWMNCNGNPACLDYAIGDAGQTPLDDEVVYGKIGSFGKLVHVSCLERAA